MKIYVCTDTIRHNDLTKKPPFAYLPPIILDDGESLERVYEYVGEGFKVTSSYARTPPGEQAQPERTDAGARHVWIEVL